jgi:glutamyl-Q tRNA(Asp) synthetase
MSTAHRPVAYRGRFAPSPTGPLHFGSLVTAVGSYVQAKSQGGKWLLRMDDIDPPREVPGAADHILRTLEAFGLGWDEPVLYQSRRHEAYEAALATLRTAGLSYPCACSRKEIAARQEKQAVSVYPGTCRQGPPAGRQGRAVRLRLPAGEVHFEDLLQGAVRRDAATQLGDFVIRRADGLFAYHLAAVVDEAEQGISEVVRGADLLDATAYQICLQRLLGLPQPRYLHLPVAVNAQGQKLSKQTYAAAIDPRQAGPLLTQALAFLGHPPPAALQGAPCRELLAWAVAHWSLARLPRMTALPVEARHQA